MPIALMLKWFTSSPAGRIVGGLIVAALLFGGFRIWLRYHDNRIFDEGRQHGVSQTLAEEAKRIEAQIKIKQQQIDQDKLTVQQARAAVDAERGAIEKTRIDLKSSVGRQIDQLGATMRQDREKVISIPVSELGSAIELACADLRERGSIPPADTTSAPTTNTTPISTGTPAKSRPPY